MGNHPLGSPTGGKGSDFNKILLWPVALTLGNGETAAFMKVYQYSAMIIHLKRECIILYLEHGMAYLVFWMVYLGYWTVYLVIGTVYLLFLLFLDDVFCI